MHLQSQRGVVLIVALVMLLIVTLLGVVSMQGARFQMKMTNNAQERQQAFNSAEATLAAAERVISTGGYPLSSFEVACAGANCFNANCNNGLCFSGVFNQGVFQAQKNCALGALPATEVWNNPAIWATNNRHKSVVLPAAVQGQQVTGMYIIEFRCFIDGPSGTVENDLGDIFYRITALGTSFAGNAQVMVQSTYRSSVP